MDPDPYWEYGSTKLLNMDLDPQHCNIYVFTVYMYCSPKFVNFLYIPLSKICCKVYRYHRRRMELEDIAKVVSSDREEKFVQFLAALSVLPRSI